MPWTDQEFETEMGKAFPHLAGNREALLRAARIMCELHSGKLSKIDLPDGSAILIEN